jgi:hypothetical protein
MEASTVQVNIVFTMKVILSVIYFVQMCEHEISEIYAMNLFSSVMPLMLKGLTSCPSRATI